MPEISCRWLGDQLRPIDRDQPWCNDNLVVGMIYKFEPSFPRNMNSHRHQFAFIKEGFKQLPERLARRFENEEHLRKWLLIQERYADTKEYLFSSVQDMRQCLVFAQEASRISRDYAVFKIDEANLILTVITAKSQSVKNMGAGEFNASKRAILDRLAGMIGVTPDELKANAKNTT